MKNIILTTISVISMVVWPLDNFSFAQTGGQLHSGNVLGNPTASEAVPVDATLTSMFDRVFGTTPGLVPTRGSSTWTGQPPTTFPLTRIILTSTKTFYVNPSSTVAAACGVFLCNPGSNANNCSTSAAPCLTMNFSLAYIAATYDFAGQSVNVQAADGSFSECVNLPAYLTTSNTDKNVFILGHSGSNTLVSFTCSGSNAFTSVNSPQGWVLKNFTVNASKSCLFSDYDGHIYWDGGNFGSCTNSQVQAGGPGAFIEFVNHPYTVSGGSQYHAVVGANAEIVWQSTAPATFLGNPNFSVALFGSARNGIIDEHFAIASFTGSYTGATYALSGPSMTFFSGAASTSNSIQYFGASTISTSETNYQTYASPLTEIVQLYVNVTNPPGGSDTFVFTLRQGAGNTSLTCTITGAQTSCNDSSHLSGNSYSAGSVYDVKVVSSATAATALMSASVVIRP